MRSSLLSLCAILTLIGLLVRAQPESTGRWVWEDSVRTITIRPLQHPDQIVWSLAKKSEHTATVTRSPDGTQLAIFLFNPHQFLVWSSRGARFYQGEFLDSEGPMQMAFSPDNRYLLLRVAPVFGNFDVNSGRLYSLDLETGETRLWEHIATDAEWTTARRFTFQKQLDNPIRVTVDLSQSE